MPCVSAQYTHSRVLAKALRAQSWEPCEPAEGGPRPALAEVMGPLDHELSASRLVTAVRRDILKDRLKLPTLGARTALTVVLPIFALGCVVERCEWTSDVTSAPNDTAT